mgnify:CR=1 FL=1|jgi:hypothetical protein
MSECINYRKNKVSIEYNNLNKNINKNLCMFISIETYGRKRGR